MLSQTDTHISVREAAEHLHVTPQTVRTYIRNGDLPAARLPSGYIRIPRESVEAILTPSAPEAGAGMTTAERIRQERIAQGLPASVEDAGALRRIATLVAGNANTRRDGRVQRRTGGPRDGQDHANT